MNDTLELLARSVDDAAPPDALRARSVRDAAAGFDASDDPVFRDRLAGLQLDVRHLGDAYRGFAQRLATGQPIGPEVSMLKIWSTETFQRIADLIVETAGASGALQGMTALGGEPADVTGIWYKARPATIYGGSNEIQRNIIARQVLDLPAR